jgi:nicotinate-nucleotide adenylyltransferase
VCAIEGELPAPNLTLHTLQALSRRHRDLQLRFVLGSDLRRETPAWHDFASICALAPPLWVARQGHDAGAGEPALPDISSSEIRRRLAAGQATTGLLAPAVAEYIRAHDLYR